MVSRTPVMSNCPTIGAANPCVAHPRLAAKTGAVASLDDDGAYDSNDVYAEVAARHPAAADRATVRECGAARSRREHADAERPAHLQCIRQRGRLGWHKACGYNWHALVEADMSRWMRVIGEGLRSQTDGRQASEVAIA